MSFLLQHGYKFEINETVGAADVDLKWLTLAKGIKSIDPDNNEKTDQTEYYDGNGAAETSVVGSQKTFGFEGHRDYADEAQNLIFNKLSHKVGPDRDIEYKVTYPDGTKLKGRATVVNIKDPGGEAGSKGEMSFEIHYAGKPTLTPVV